MRDEERNQMGTITETLAKLRASWRDPSHALQEHVTAGDAGAAPNAARRHDNPGLLAELESLEAERARIHSLLMGEQAAGAGELDTLAQRVERLRKDFSSLMP